MLQEGWNYWVALVIGVMAGFAVGTLSEVLIIRRLTKASKLGLLAATLGLAQLLLVAQTQVPLTSPAAPYPAGLHTSVKVLGVALFGEHLVVLAIIPVTILGLGAFLTRSRWGLAIRASADNPNAARLAGMSPHRISLIVWSLAGGLSALTFILNAPIRGSVSGIVTEGLGPSLLLRAMAAALFGRFVSLPLTLAGGVALGVFEAQAFINTDPGTVDALVFLVVGILVLTRIRDTEESAAVTRSGGAPPIATWLPRSARRTVTLIGVAVVVRAAAHRHEPIAAGALQPPRRALHDHRRVGGGRHRLVGPAVVVSFAFVGVGTIVTYALNVRGMSYGWACLYAMGAGVVAAIAVGLPALHVRGLFLAVTVLRSRVAATGWLLPHQRLFGGLRRGLHPPRVARSVRLRFATHVLLPRGRRARRGRAHRQRTPRHRCRPEHPRRPRERALRRSDDDLVGAGQAVGLRAVRRNRRARGWVARRSRTGNSAAADFTASESLRVVAVAIIGGVGSISGALVGAIFVLGLPAMIGETDTVRLLTGGVGLLAVLLIEPGGLLELFRKGAAAIAGRLGLQPHLAIAVAPDETVAAEADADIAPPAPAAGRNRGCRGERGTPSPRRRCSRSPT